MKFIRMLLLILSILLVMSTATASTTIERPETVVSSKVTPKTFGTNPLVLIIKDVDPWDYPANEMALQELNVSYDVITSAELSSVDLSRYKIVIVASDQYTSTYNNLVSNRDKLADFVYRGGVLIAHACDCGWHVGSWTESWLPLGVTKVNVYGQNLSIVDYTSLIVNGTPHGGRLTDSDLDNWYYSTHGYFTNLPANARIIIGIASNPTEMPTYIEYSYGAGKILATMQTIEWPWSGHRDDLGETQKNLLRNEIEYAVRFVNRPYAITVHFHYPPGWVAGDPLPERDVAMIEKARELNAKYVRFDIWWKDIEPEEDKFNENAIAYYKAIIEEIKKNGMEPLVIVGTGIPDWAMWKLLPLPFKLYLIKYDDVKKIVKVPRDAELRIVRSDTENIVAKFSNDKFTLIVPKNAVVEEIPTGKVKVEKVIEFARHNRIPIRNLEIDKEEFVYVNMLVSDEFLKEAEEYTEKIASEIGDEVYYYQLGNEPNHALDLIYWLDGPKYIKALYTGINLSDDGFETAVNFFVDPPHDSPGPWLWTDSVISYLNSVGDCIDIVGIDHYPGTWSLEPYDSWYQIDVLFNITDKYGKKVAVMETGFSTWEPFMHSEQDQRQFINTALPAIREKADSSGKELIFVGWYELVDEENPSVPLPQEYNFGILHSDLTPKLGYNDLKQQFGWW